MKNRNSERTISTAAACLLLYIETTSFTKDMIYSRSFALITPSGVGLSWQLYVSREWSQGWVLNLHSENYRWAYKSVGTCEPEVVYAFIMRRRNNYIFPRRHFCVATVTSEKMKHLSNNIKTYIAINISRFTVKYMQNYFTLLTFLGNTKKWGHKFARKVVLDATICITWLFFRSMQNAAVSTVSILWS